MADWLSFPDWLNGELQAREWKQADLVRKARIDSGLLSRILSGERRPSVAVCIGIAEALSLPPQEVAARAGRVPPSPEPTILTDRLLAIAAQLSEDEMRDLLDYAELIKRRRKRKSTE